jgi:uncharacterized membrane protein
LLNVPSRVLLSHVIDGFHAAMNFLVICVFTPASDHFLAKSVNVHSVAAII